MSQFEKKDPLQELIDKVSCGRCRNAKQTTCKCGKATGGGGKTEGSGKAENSDENEKDEDHSRRRMFR